MPPAHLSPSRASFACVSFLATLTLLTACDTPPKTLNAPLLSVTPDPIHIPLPEPSVGYAEVSVTVSNTGGYDLIISSVTLTEDDDTPELSLVDSQDWGERLVLTGGESRTLKLAWRLLDAQADAGSLRFVTNVGERVVPITTEDPDPELLFSLTPEGRQVDGGLELELSGVPDGGWRRAELRALSVGGAPVTLERVCLVDGAGSCVEGAEALPFRLCEGAGATPSSCPPVEDLSPIAFDASRTFSVLFEPPPGSAESYVGRLSVRSDASTAPDFLVRFKASTCAQDPSAVGCAGRAGVEGARLAAGAARMEGGGVTLSGILTESGHSSSSAAHSLTGTLAQ